MSNLLIHFSTMEDPRRTTKGIFLHSLTDILYHLHIEYTGKGF